jgi:quercetin dioxygenase-like cupin family protein
MDGGAARLKHASMDFTHTKTSVLQRLEEVVPTEVAGGSIAVRLRAEETGGRLGLIENVIPAGFAGLPLHVHPSFDEAFFVLGGELTFRVGDDVLAASSGTLVYAPGDVPHTFAEPNGRPARLLVWVSPAGHEHYFEVMAAEMSRAGGRPSPEFFTGLMVEHGIESVGSPDPYAR